MKERVRRRAYKVTSGEKRNGECRYGGVGIHCEGPNNLLSLIETDLIHLSGSKSAVVTQALWRAVYECVCKQLKGSWCEFCPLLNLEAACSPGNGLRLHSWSVYFRLGILQFP